MTLVDLKITEDSPGTHAVRFVQRGTDAQGRPIIAQEVYLGPRIPLGATVAQRKYSVGASAVTLNPPAGSEWAWVFAKDGDLGFWENGTVPTPTDSVPLFSTQAWSLEIPDLTQFKMISLTGVAVNVFVLFSQRG